MCQKINTKNPKQKGYDDNFQVEVLAKIEIILGASCAVNVCRMSHRKWRKIWQLLIRLPDLALLGCCLLSLHILCDILQTFTVQGAPPLPCPIVIVRCPLIHRLVSAATLTYRRLHNNINNRRSQAGSFGGYISISKEPSFMRESSKFGFTN